MLLTTYITLHKPQTDVLYVSVADLFQIGSHTDAILEKNGHHRETLLILLKHSLTEILILIVILYTDVSWISVGLEYVFMLVICV